MRISVSSTTEKTSAYGCGQVSPCTTNRHLARTSPHLGYCRATNDAQATPRRAHGTSFSIPDRPESGCHAHIRFFHHGKGECIWLWSSQPQRYESTSSKDVTALRVFQSYKRCTGNPSPRVRHQLFDNRPSRVWLPCAYPFLPPRKRRVHMGVVKSAPALRIDL
jgi:hypothetical protein